MAWARALNRARASPQGLAASVAATHALRATWRLLAGQSTKPDAQPSPSAAPGTHALAVALFFCRRGAKFLIRIGHGLWEGEEERQRGGPRLEDPEKVGFLGTSIGRGAARGSAEGASGGCGGVASRAARCRILHRAAPQRRGVLEGRALRRKYAIPGPRRAITRSYPTGEGGPRARPRLWLDAPSARGEGALNDRARRDDPRTRSTHLASRRTSPRRPAPRGGTATRLRWIA